jgi:hypothetical protein
MVNPKKELPIAFAITPANIYDSQQLPTLYKIIKTYDNNLHERIHSLFQLFTMMVQNNDYFSGFFESLIKKNYLENNIKWNLIYFQDVGKK